MIFSICCVTRDCDFINDFIEYHLNLGFDRITIYDNLSVNPVVYDHPRVIIIKYSGFYGAGYIPYNDHAKQYANEVGFTAYIDEDEFIETKGLSIQDAMNPYINYDSLALDWRLFGDRIDEGNNATKIFEKYRYHIPNEWKDPQGLNYVKSIIRNNAIHKFIDPHYAILKEGKLNRGVNGNIVNGSVTDKKDVTGFCINHYYFRGKEEYIKRQTRPIAGRETRKIEDVIDMYNNCNNLCTEKTL